MDVQAFEQRREQADFTDALRSVRQEAGMAERVSGEKLPGDKQGGLQPDAQITVGGKPKQNKASAGAGEIIDQSLQPAYEAGAKVNEALSSGISTAGRMVGLPSEQADFTGDVLGYQAPENNLDSALTALPFLGAVKGAKRGAKAAGKLAKGAETVQDATVPAVTTLKSEKDVKAVIDAPAGQGKTFVILTESAPAKPVGEGFKAGSLESLVRKVGPYETYKVQGFYKGVPEDSIMLVSGKPNDNELLTKALRLAKSAGQESIATNEGILFTDGSLHPRAGLAIYGDEAKLQPGYSVIQTEAGEIPFSTPINWDSKGASTYKHDYTGISFSGQRFLNVPPSQHFLNEIPGELNFKQVARYQNETKVPGVQVYDFQDNPLNLPSQGYEEILKSQGYRAAITYGPDGVPSLHTLESTPVSRVTDRTRPFYGPQVGVKSIGQPKVVFPESLPERVSAGIAEGNVDKSARKDLVQMGAAMLAQPEMSSAKVAAEGNALAAGEKKVLSTRTGKNLKMSGVEDLTHENVQDALAYLSAEDQSADPAVRKGWENLIRQIEKQFDDLGLQAKVQYVDGQPYQSAEQMVKEFSETGILKISKDFNEHPVFTPEQNLKFRAVHDYAGHIQPGHDFSMKGESGTFKTHADSIQGKDAQDALRVEVLGQASSMLASGGKFPKQKIFDLEKQRQKLGLIEGSSADLFQSWVKSFEDRLPDAAKGKLSLEEYRDLFNDSVKAYTAHLKKAEGQIPNTRTLLGYMNDSHGQSIQDWYAGARPELDRLFGDDADLMAKFIALFSPQSDVKQNVERAFAAYRSYKLGNRSAVELVRAAGVPDPEKYAALLHNMERVLRSPDEQLSGRKVINYLAAINGDKNAVVIDRHMGGMFGLDVIDEPAYSFIEDHIRMIAQETGKAPSEVQATLWGAWKALKGQSGELKNLDEFIKEFAAQNPDLLFQGHKLDEAGITRLQAAWFMTKIMSGAAVGATTGSDPGEQLRNALIGAGLGAIASKPFVQKIGNALRENAPAKWFKPAGHLAPEPVRPMTPQEALKAADAEAAQKARLDALRNKPKTVTVGNETYELDLKALDTPEQVKQAVDEMARVYKKQLEGGALKPGSRGVIPDALAKRLAEHLGLTEEDVLNRTRGSVDAAEHVFAYADVMDAAKTRAMQSLEFFNAGNKSFETEVVKDIDRYVQVGYQLDGLLEELGRGLRIAGQPEVKGLTQGFRGFVGPFELMQKHGSMNGESIAALVKEVGLERAAGVGKAVERAGLWDMVAEVTYGFTLSNPRTNAVNVGSSAVLNPILTMMTRGMAEVAGSGAVVDGEARAMLYGYFNGVQRMMRAVAQTYREGGALELMRSIRNVKPLDKSGAAADKSGVASRHAITAENVSALMPQPFKFDPNGWLGKIVDAAGSSIRIPSQLMELGDHFSYAVNYDMAMSARAFREGVKLGKEGKALEEFVAKEMLNPTREIKNEAEKFAEHEIFKSLIDGHTGKIVEGLGHPALRPFITFVRTPVNIFKYNLEGVPVLNLALKSVREDIKAGGARRDLAMAKMTLGGSIAAIAGMMAMNDRITGNGPDNPKLRKLWLIDHQPYSVKLPGVDKWVSYRYFDPVSSWFGMAADATHFMSFDKDDLTGGEATMAIALGFMRNFTDKTYTRDTFEFLDQLSVRPGENAETSLKSFERYMDKKATIYVPFSSLSRAVRNAIDPYVREAFTLMEKIQNTIPGWSKGLPEALDFFGDPITNPRFNSFLPFPLKDDTGDDVIDEIIRVRANVGMPSRVFDGQDLTSQEYHDLVYARGKGVKEEIGKDLREGLIELFNTEDYRRHSTTDAMRKLMIEKIVEAYTQAGYAHMANPSGVNNQRFLKYREAQKKAEALTGQKLNLNFGGQ